MKILFMHGSGTPMDHPFLEAAAAAMRAAGLEVVRREFAYMQRSRIQGQRPGFPSRFPVLQQELRQMAEEVRPDLLGGKSLGGRVALSVAAELPLRGLVLFGYPFHPPGKPERTRLQEFAGLTCPTLILQGSRDPFGTRAEVSGYVLPEPVRLHWIEGGDHDWRGARTPFGEAEQALRGWLSDR